VEPDRQLALLRRFEPVVRYTAGELFLPAPVDDFVGGCALVRDEGGQRHELALAGTLTLDALAELGRRQATGALSLRRVARPLERREHRTWRRTGPRFRASSRFAVVALPSRLLDAAFRLTLVLRGTVPGGFTAAAHQAYARVDQPPTYYGRAVRDGGYLVLQYWFFYWMNDWRSSFGGVNDHEGDWEQVSLFLTDSDAASGAADGPTPRWVVYSAHDTVGDDLRRRWDDPDLALVGEHPVVYAGAGSHAGAYLPGEYLVKVPLDLPDWARRTMAGVRRLLSGHEGPWAGLALPYLDYHRGDGIAVGPGGDRDWHAVPIDDSTRWVRDYRGLWGLDTRDRFGGERAPAGPRYERNGGVRLSWGQPVAWAGLDREPPDDAEARAELAAAGRVVAARLAETRENLAAQRTLLRAARTADRLRGVPVHRPGRKQRAMISQVATLREREADLRALLETADHAEDLPDEGPHAHLRTRALPLELDRRRQGRLVRLWSAATSSLVLAGLGLLLVTGRRPDLAEVGFVAAVLVAVEAVLRRRLVRLVVAVGLAAVTLTSAWSVVTVVRRNLPLALGATLIVAAAVLAYLTISQGLRRR
jgi:hypothetical protein